MPLPALYGIAAGIAMSLALVGRRIHEALLADVLSGRQGTGKLWLTAAMMLIAVFLILVGAVVVLVVILRSRAPAVPI